MGNGTKKTIAILGAGPAGLGVAYKLLKNVDNIRVIVFEKEVQEGGICASFVKHGLFFDYGSHRFHPTAGIAVKSDIQDLLGAKIKRRKKRGRVYLAERYLNYPFNIIQILSRMPVSFSVGIIKDILQKALCQQKYKKNATYEDLLMKNFGKNISEKFYFPYAEKLWGLQPNLISAEQARVRISSNSFFNLLKKVLISTFLKEYSDSSTYFYPEKGIGQIFQSYKEEIEKMGGIIYFNHEVFRITKTNKSKYIIKSSVMASDIKNQVCEYNCDFVFSTLPISIMPAILECHDENVNNAAGKLKYRAMLFHYMVLEANHFTEYDAHYYPDLDCIFSRVSEPKNYYQGLLPEKLTGICSEIPCDEDSDLFYMPEKDLTKKIICDLKKSGLEIKAPIIDVFVVRKKTIYPIYDLGYANNFFVVNNYLVKADNLISLGRQGLFVHDNFHHALDMGYKAADCMDAEGIFDKNKWLTYRKGFEKNVVID